MIGNCDCCDRENVPVKNVVFSGMDTTACFVCQGADDAEDAQQAELEMAHNQVAEAGKAAIAIRNELDRVRIERDSWEAQFHSAAAAASEYSEFWERHHGDFDQFGNYLPYSQIDGDLRAAKAEIERLKASSVSRPHLSTPETK